MQPSVSLLKGLWYIVFIICRNKYCVITYIPCANEIMFSGGNKFLHHKAFAVTTQVLPDSVIYKALLEKKHERTEQKREKHIIAGYPQAFVLYLDWVKWNLTAVNHITGMYNRG